MFIIVLLVGCENSTENVDEKKEFRNEAASSVNENMDYAFATDSLTDIWHIEDHIFDDEELDEDSLFHFTDEYIMDGENFESLNEYEQGLAMKTSAIISKCIEGKYDDVELFEDDLEEYYDILENGDDFFID
jgi:hypothetical protein